MTGKGCREERFLKLQKLKTGHLRIRLYKNGKIQNHLIHRLLLEAFIGPCPFGKEVCHNNGDPSNNFIENLRYDTHKNNQKDMTKHGTAQFKPIWLYKTGQDHPMSKFNNKDILNIRKLHKEGLTNIEIGKIYKTSYKNIWRIVNNKRWKHIKDGEL